MQLKPQDLLIALKLVTRGEREWSYNALARELGMSPAEVHAGVKRALRARLVVVGVAGRPARPVLRALEEFVLHGVRYVFVPEEGALTRGMATAWAAPMFAFEFVSVNDPPPVWPDPQGKTRGQSLSPLYRSAPFAAMQDEHLYELLALVDIFRFGRARERKFAKDFFKMRMEEHRYAGAES